jgi:hypothetical protein
MRLRDFPVPPAELRGRAEYLWPAGPATVLRGGTDTSRMLVGEQVIGWRAACECGWRCSVMYPRSEWPSSNGVAQPPEVDGWESVTGCFRD